MNDFLKILALALFATIAAGELGDVRHADAAQSSPTSSPTATPAPSGGGNDPCGGDGRLLATLNRPTVGYSACAVPPGTLLFEEGYQNQQQGAGLDTFLIQYPQSFTRIGVKPRLEIDLIGPYGNKLAVPDGTGGYSRTHGYQDSGLGFKYEFEPKGKFTIGVDGLYTAPNGSAGFTNGGSTETANLDIAYAVTPSFGVGTTQAFSSSSGFKADGSAARFGVWTPSVVFTQQLNHYYQLYAEYVYVSKLAPDQNGRAFVDYGVQHLLGKCFELDLELGNAITGDKNLRFHYFGVGIGWQVR